MATAVSLSRRQIIRLRMQALGLVPPPDGQALPGSAAAVVRHHLAMQAQDWAASRWAIGSRLADAVDADVIAAYDAGEIVRSWPMRGTLHAVHRDDLPWLLSLLGERALSGVTRRWEFLGIDGAMLEAAREVAISALRGGRAAKRSELLDTITGEGLDLLGQRGYHTVWYLAQTGTLVYGPVRDGEHALVLADEWLPRAPAVSREQALATLALRYLAARAPAGVSDLSHWSSLGVRDCRTAFEAAGDAVVPVDAGGHQLFVLAQQLQDLDPNRRSVDSSAHALAAFDEHLLGYRRRDDVLDPEFANLVDPARNGVFRWTLVSGGRVVGTWKRRKLTRSIVAEVSLFDGQSDTVIGRLKRAIGRYGKFVGTPVEVRTAR